MNPLRHEQPDLTFRLPWGAPMHVILRAEYPVLLAVAAAASAAGTGLSMAGNAKANDKMDSMREAELLRQRGYQQEADTTFQESLKKSDVAGAEQSIEGGAAERQNAYANLRNATASLTDTPGRNQPTGSAAGGASARLSASTQATNSAWANLQGAARAKLGGYQDWGLETNIKDRRAGQDLAITSSRARNSANVLPMEMADAARSGDSLKAWGNLASALGMVAGMGAAVGAAGAGAAGAAAPVADSSGIWTPEMAASFGGMV